MLLRFLLSLEIHLHDLFTTKTGHCASCMTRSARLPSMRSYNAEWPVAPMTSNSTWNSPASWTMSRAGHDPSRCRRGDSHIQSGADDACAAPPGRRTSSPASNPGASVLSNTALFNRHITNSRSLLWRQESSASSAVLGDPIPFCAVRFQSGIK